MDSTSIVSVPYILKYFMAPLEIIHCMTHQPGELFRLPLMVDPTVKRFGYSVADAANHTCLPTLTPYTVVLVIFKYKLCSLAAPLETGTLATVPVVFPTAGVVTAEPVVKVMSLP
jgi:hypothetical protein